MDRLINGEFKASESVCARSFLLDLFLMFD